MKKGRLDQAKEIAKRLNEQENAKKADEKATKERRRSGTAAGLMNLWVYLR